MKFEEALSNLRINKILKRKSWLDTMLHMKNHDIYQLGTFIKWDCKYEDVIADDWEIVDPDDIQEFQISVNDLKKHGVSDESIQGIKKDYSLISGLKTIRLGEGEKISSLDLNIENLIKPSQFNSLIP